MLREPDAQLLSTTHEVDGNDVINIVRMRAFERRGVVRVYRYLRFFCVRRDEPEYGGLRDKTCTGFGILRAGANGSVPCNRCRREFHLPDKRPVEYFATELVVPKVVEHLLEVMSGVGLRARQIARGHLVAPSDAGDVHVVLVDHCVNTAVYSEYHPDKSRILYVWGERHLMERVPRGSALFPLVDVVEKPAGFAEHLQRVCAVEPWMVIPATRGTGVPPAFLGASAAGRASVTWTHPSPPNYGSHLIKPDSNRLVGGTRAPAATLARWEDPRAARIHTREGFREVTPTEVKELLATAHRFHLVLNTYERKARRATTAFFRDQDEREQTTMLTENETDLLVDVVRAGRPVPLRKLPCVARNQVGSLDRLYNSARGKVDVTLSAGAYRAFKKVGTGHDAVGHFDPPPDFTYAVIVPVDEST